MSTNLFALLPELVLTAVGVLIMLVEPVLAHGRSRKPLGWLAILGTGGAAVVALVQLSRLTPTGIVRAFSGTLEISSFSVFFHLVIAGVVLVTLLGSLDYFPENAPITGSNKETGVVGSGSPAGSPAGVIGHAGEYFALVLFAATGMMLMTSAVELLVVFIGLEISSIATYIMCGFRKGQATGSESSLKYFLLGSFATAFFLYGIALAFGATGSTNIAAVAAGLGTTHTPLLAFLAVALMLIGLGFKVSAAPFHVWTPDVYQGAPAPVVGLMSTAPKAAAFAVLLRILFVGFPALQSRWSILLWVLAALSMCIGNLGALLQSDVKRMLAYSSISHAGYLLVAFTALPHDGIAAAMFYTAAYSAMNVGAFAVISAISGYTERTRTLDDYTGLALRRPVLAGLLAFFLLSLIGIPFTGGFFGKFYVFTAALHAGHVWLAVVGLLNSGIACFYYLRLLAALYTRPVQEPVLHPYSATAFTPYATPAFAGASFPVATADTFPGTAAETFPGTTADTFTGTKADSWTNAPDALPGGSLPGSVSIATQAEPARAAISPTATQPRSVSKPVSIAAAFGLGLAALATLVLGILPGHSLRLARDGATAALNDVQHPHPDPAPTTPTDR